MIHPVFNQGEEGTSWYIIQRGSVNVVIYGKVCSPAQVLHFDSQNDFSCLVFSHPCFI